MPKSFEAAPWLARFRWSQPRGSHSQEGCLLTQIHSPPGITENHAIGLWGFSHRQTVCHRMSIPSRDSLSETARFTGITAHTTYNCRSHWQKQGRWWLL
jgi:hypothetical protein